MKATTVSVSIARPPATVYAFVANPENLPRWAAGLGGSIRRSGGEWIVETRDGPLTVRFVAENELGVADHYVTVKPGVEVYVPIRVIANGSGSEVLVTLFQQPDMTEAMYADDARLVERDLRTLKEVLEAAGSSRVV